MPFGPYEGETLYEISQDERGIFYLNDIFERRTFECNNIDFEEAFEVFMLDDMIQDDIYSLTMGEDEYDDE